MEMVFTILQVVICVLLVLIVLLQFGKGAQTSGFLSGSSSDSLFPTSTKGNFFTKFTTALAIAFMLNSILLTKIKSANSQSSVIKEAPIAPLAPSETPTDLSGEENLPPETQAVQEKQTDGDSE